MTTTTQHVTCTTCPIGCRVAVTLEGEIPVAVAGNRCKRGDEYARAEVTDPRRVVTSTVWSHNASGERKLLPVRTRHAVPKRLMFDIVARLAATEISLPVAMGQILITDAAGSGVDIVASRALQ